MYFYNVKLLDLKMKGKKNLLNLSKKNERYQTSNRGPFAAGATHQRCVLSEQLCSLQQKFKLFTSLFHVVYLVCFYLLLFLFFVFQ